MPLVNKKSKYFTHYMYKIQISLDNRVSTITEENIWGWIVWWNHIKPFRTNLKNNFFYLQNITKQVMILVFVPLLW